MSELDFSNMLHCDRSNPVPLYYQISQQISDLIDRGELGKTVKLPTEHELAALLGVSRLTARQAYNNLEKAGYIRRVKSRGTFIKDMSGKKSASQIALVLFQITAATSKIIDAAGDSLKEAGLELAIRYTNADLAREREIIREIAESGIRGVVACPVVIDGRDNSAAYKSLVAAGTKVALVDRRLAGLDLPYAGFDNFQSGIVAGERLLGSGAERFVFLASSAQATSILERQAGFERALSKNGVPSSRISSILIPYHKTGFAGAVELLMERFKEMKENGGLPAAIFSGMSPLTLASYKAARELGLAIPSDISVLSGDDDEEAFPLLDPPVTAFRQPLDELGRAAVKELLASIKEPSAPPRDVVFSMELISRKSCGE